MKCELIKNSKKVAKMIIFANEFGGIFSSILQINVSSCNDQERQKLLHWKKM